MPNVTRAARLLSLTLVAGLAFAGCGAATSPVTSSAPPASTDPAGGASGSTGGGTSGDPGAGDPALVRPQPGRLNPHPVAPHLLQASVDGRHVLVKVSWYGGIEPCSVLDSVVAARSGQTIALTVIEGSSDLTAVCAEIAMLKATIVDLGDLEPGAWTITAPDGDAPPIELTIS